MPPEEVAALIERRGDRLAGVARLVVDVTDRSPDEVADLILGAARFDF